MVSEALRSFLFDLGFLTCEISEVEDSRSSDLTSLVYFDLLDGGQVDRKDPLDADGTRHLSDREGL